MTFNRNSIIVSMVAAAIALGSADVLAQRRGQDRRSPSGPSESRPEGRGTPRRATPPPARPEAVWPEPRRPQAPGRMAPSRPETRPDSQAGRGGRNPRPEARVMPQGRAVPRVGPAPYSAPRYENQRYNGQRYSPPRYVASRYVSPYRYTGPRPAYRTPYYAFRPRTRLNFGIYIGFPAGFPSWYDPYRPGVYRYYQPGDAYGGISFDIQPYDAEIYVDGEYAGTASEFSPYEAPLTLRAGRHRIDLDAPGWAPLSFDITVLPRQVIPYQGSLGR